MSDRFQSGEGHRSVLATGAVAAPTLAAGGFAARELYDIAKRHGGKIYSFSSRGKQIFSAPGKAPNLFDLKGAMANPGMTMSEMQRMAADFYGNRPLKRAFNPDTAIRRTRKLFGQMVNQPTKHTLLSHSITNARMVAMTTAEAAEHIASDVLPILSVDQMKAYFNERSEVGHFLKNEKFIRALHSNLTKARRLTDTGVPDVLPRMGQTANLVYREMDKGGSAWEALHRYRPAFAAAIENEMGTFSSVKLVSEDVVDGKIGRVLGVSFSKGVGKRMRELTVPIIDAATGQARGGKHFSIVGAGRNIYNEDVSLPADVFMARNLGGTWTKERLAALKLEKQRAFVFGAVDPLDEWSQALPDGALHGTTAEAIRLRSQQHIPTVLPQFKNLEGAPVHLNDLKPQERILLEERIQNHHGLIKLSSEGSFNKGVRDSASTELLHFGGVTDPSKQMAEYRSLSKEFRLVADANAETIKPYLGTTAAKDMLGSATAGAAGVRVGGISPVAATLLGDLPTRVQDLYLPQTEKNFVGHLMRMRQMDEIQAKAVWERTKRLLQHGSNLQSANAIGRLGEGGLLIRNGFGGHWLDRTVTYKVNDLRLSQSQVEHFQGNHFGNGLVLGFGSDGKFIHARGHQNFLAEAPKALGGGQYAISVLERYRMESGTKFDALGIKGLAVSVDQAYGGADPEVMNGARRLLNHLAISTAKPGEMVNLIGEDVNALALMNFNHDKADPVHSILGAATDTMRRLEGAASRPMVGSMTAAQIRSRTEHSAALRSIAEAFKSEISKHHISYTDGQLLEHSAEIAKLSSQERRQRISSLVELSEQMMEKVGEHIRAHGGQGDQLFSNYRRGLRLAGAEPGKNSFLHYSIQNSLAGNIYAWNTTQVGVPSQTKLTFDMQSMLYGNGYHATLKHLQDKLVYPQGDPGEAWELMKHVTAGDFSKPLGDAVSMEDAFPEGLRGSMRTPAARQGTVFDPDNLLAAANYSLDLGEGAERRYIPVLGHEAFKGKANRFGDAGEFSTSDLERGIRKIANTTGPERESSIDEYLHVLRTATYGKDGILRADAVHTKAVSAFIQTASSNLGDVNGVWNPFTVRIGSDMAKKMNVGHGDYAVLTRHPVSSTPFVQVQIDKNLKGTNLIGIDAGVHTSLHADDDGDQALLFPIEKSSAAEAEAASAVHNADSLQHKQLRISNAMLGVGDDTRRLNQTQIGSVRDRLSKWMDKAANRAGITRSRTTGAAVGSMSNVLTHMQMQLEQNSRFVGKDAEKAMLSNIFWQATRQTPIAAQKGTVEGFDLIQAQKFTSQMNSAMGKGKAGTDEMHATLLNLLDKFEKPTAWIPEMAEIGIQGKHGDEVRPMLTWLQSNKSSIEKFQSGIEPDVTRLHRMLTASEHAIKPEAMPALDQTVKNMRDLMPYQQSSVRSAVTAADRAAEETGHINSVTAQAKLGAKRISERFSEVREAVKADINMRPALKWAGIAAGVAAVAGLMTARPSFDRRKSSNSLRPEEVAGTQDHIPSEPLAGSRSPSAPPRRTQEAPAQARTSIVTPMQTAVNLDVQMRGDNQSDSVERAKLMARMADPVSRNSNLTVINRDATRMSSLRFKARMRESLDQ